MECDNPLAPGLVDCSTSAYLGVKRTGRNSASMHSVLPARNLLFLAPLHSPQFRCVLQRRLRVSLRRVTTLPCKSCFVFSAFVCVHFSGQLWVKGIVRRLANKYRSKTLRISRHFNFLFSIFISFRVFCTYFVFNLRSSASICGFNYHSWRPTE